GGFVGCGRCTSLLQLVWRLDVSVSIALGGPLAVARWHPNVRGRWGDVAGQDGSGGRHAAMQSSAAVPPMPVLGPSEQDRSAPLPLLDGLSPTIGWSFQGPRGSGAAFAILHRRRVWGTLEVIESFPLTEDGWAKAWQSLTKWNPEAAQKVLAGTLAT